MIKIRALWLLVLIASSAFAIGAQTRVDTLLNYLGDGGKSKHVMIFAHRGDWRAAPENSLLAFQRCIDAGLDGIEVDLQMTKDSVLVAMHDPTLDRTTTGKGNVSDYTLDEIKQLKLLSPIGVVSRQTVPTLEEVFALAKDKILIQVDKWKPFKEKVVELARQCGCEKQIIIRATSTSKYNTEHYGGLFDNVMLMPVLVCKGRPDEAKFDDFLNNYNCPCIALSFTRTDFPILKRAGEIKERGYRLWLNSLWDTFSAGHDDELALTDPEAAYGWLLDFGANVIFSDNPMLLKDYLHSVNRRDF